MSFIIRGKHVIVLGDKTTHGGEVVTGSEKFRYRGKPVASVGDKVSCPRCGGVFEILEGVSSVFNNGKPIAVHDCLTSCGARLIAPGEQGNAQVMQGGILDFLLPWRKETPEPLIPGRGLSPEEYCKYVDVLKNSQVFKDTVQLMAALTKKIRLNILVGSCKMLMVRFAL